MRANISVGESKKVLDKFPDDMIVFSVGLGETDTDVNICNAVLKHSAKASLFNRDFVSKYPYTNEDNSRICGVLLDHLSL